MENGGSPIDGLTVTMRLTGDLFGYSTSDGVQQCNECWSLQLNAVAAKGQVPGIEQYVLLYYNGYMSVSMSFFKSGEGGTDFIMSSVSIEKYLPQAVLVSGFSVSMTLMMNSTENVQGVEATATAANGTILWDGTVDIDNPVNQFYYGASPQSLETQIVGFQLDLVGDGNSQPAVFTSGVGTFTYSTLSNVAFSTEPQASFSYVGFKGTADGAVTGETSNIAYGAPT